MSIASFADLKLQVMRLMEGDNITSGEIETATLNQIVGLAERRIYREVRSRHNEKAFSSVSVSGNVATLPADFESCSVVHFGARTLEPVSEEWLRQYNVNRTGTPAYVAEAGSGLMFGPPAEDGDVLQGRYFYRIEDLSDSSFASNTLIQKEPDLFIYACLTEGATFFGKDASLWEARYRGIVDRLNNARTGGAFSVGRIRIRPNSGVLEVLAKIAKDVREPLSPSVYAEDYADEYA